MKLGDKIFKLRKEKGYSQEELAERIDVTRQTISNWELNETSPNPNQLKLLSKEFNVSIDELLDNDIEGILIKKVDNTEHIVKLVLKIILGIIIAFFCYIIIVIIYKNTRETGRRIEETIKCTLYDENHSYNIVYEELTGIPRVSGGDQYFYDILDLGKYNDAHQIFNIINDYVKKNGGDCHMEEVGIYDN